jgi:hypothetical protein
MKSTSVSPVRVDDDVLVMGPVRVSFQRTLRIPEQGIHSLPPSLGSFPLRRVEDYPATAPAAWLGRGGVMLPVYQREAMWLNFDSDEPAALQVGVGKVCAVSGEPWTEKLAKHPQNYVALPKQPWLDGINAGDGFIRQFVAVPLGLGATVEGQVTGVEEHGGVQLRALGLGEKALARWQEEQRVRRRARAAHKPFGGAAGMSCMAAAPPSPDMGLGAGGRMRQEIYADERKKGGYDPDRSWRVFVHLCSAAQWTAITGEAAPATPVDREAYVRAGLPWFDYYDSDSTDLPASETLAGVKTVGEVLGGGEPPFTPTDPGTVIALKDTHSDTVADGDW